MAYKFQPASEEERRLVLALQERVKADASIKHEFGFVKTLRFLRGRKGDADKAFRAMAKHDQWRTSQDVDTVSEKNVSVDCRRKLIFGENLRLKDGTPVVYIIVRYHDKHESDLEELKTYIVSAFEEALLLSAPSEERMSIVFDLAGFNLSCMDYEAVRAIIDILSFNYPETLSRALLINAPMLFSACWYVIAPWIDEVTRAKVVFDSAAKIAEHADVRTVPRDVTGVPRPASS